MAKGMTLKEWVESNLDGEWTGPNTFKLNGPQKIRLPSWIQVGRTEESKNDILIIPTGSVKIIT